MGNYVKPEKIEWKRNIADLEKRSERLFSIGWNISVACKLLAVCVVLMVISGSAWILYAKMYLNASIQDFQVWTLLLISVTGIGVMTVIGVDCLVANPMILKAIALGRKCRQLKMDGWNKKPASSEQAVC